MEKLKNKNLSYFFGVYDITCTFDESSGDNTVCVLTVF